MSYFMPSTTVKNREFDRRIAKCIETFLDDDSDHEHHMNDLASACQTDEQWNIVCDTIHMAGDPEFIIGELPADYPLGAWDVDAWNYLRGETVPIVVTDRVQAQPITGEIHGYGVFDSYQTITIKVSKDDMERLLHMRQVSIVEVKGK